jgi:hypothetical protein
MLMHNYRLRREPKIWHLVLLTAAAVALNVCHPSTLGLDAESSLLGEEEVVSQAIFGPAPAGESR